MSIRAKYLGTLDADALTVPCAYCMAGVGAECVDRSGKRLRRVHSSRAMTLIRNANVKTGKQNDLPERLKASYPHSPIVSEAIAFILELLEYREKYAEIVVRCRNTPGSCFCGVHHSQTMAKE